MKCGMNKGGPGGNRTRGSTTRVVNPPRNSAAEPRGPGKGREKGHSTPRVRKTRPVTRYDSRLSAYATRSLTSELPQGQSLLSPLLTWQSLIELS